MMEMFWGAVVAFLGGNWPFLLAGGAVVLLFYAMKRWFINPDNKYAKYLPYVYQAVKMAEKYIPDKKEGAEETALNKADEALKYFCQFYEEAEGVEPDAALMNWVKRVKELVLHDIEKHKTV